jgi:hypothetical protein
MTKDGVVTYTRYAETNLKPGINWPQFTVRYSRFIIDSSEIERFEDKETKVYNNQLEFILLTTKIFAEAGMANS